MNRLALGLSLLLSTAPIALANDSTAELKAGGLVFIMNDNVTMASEDLKISEKEVTVDYVFHNNDAVDRNVTVAFPMPEILGNPYIPVSVPDTTKDNFMDFEVTVDGEPVETKLQQRANVAGIDVTDELTAAGVPLQPFTDEAAAALDKLPAETLADWQRRGIVINDQYDDGSGMKDHMSPFWALKSTYYWDMTFPANADVKVSHRYKPSVGGTVGITFLNSDPELATQPDNMLGEFVGPQYDDYVRRYCIDDDIKKAIRKAQKANKGTDYEYHPYWEKRISYILTTGQNWGGGTIGKFHLTIDKGKADNLVSFCGTGVEKTGPTTFEINATDYYPERDLDILILEKPEVQ